jgi:hypothetical protein
MFEFSGNVIVLLAFSGNFIFVSNNCVNAYAENQKITHPNE